MGSAASTKTRSQTTSETSAHSAAALIDRCLAAKVRNSDNLMAKHFTEEYVLSLTPKLRSRLLKICQSGAENADSSVGKGFTQLND